MVSPLSIRSWLISAGLFGSREVLSDDYMIRSVAAVAGVYGHDSANGSLTLNVRHAEPTDSDQKANWLLAPDGSIFWSGDLSLRLS